MRKLIKAVILVSIFVGNIFNTLVGIFFPLLFFWSLFTVIALVIYAFYAWMVWLIQFLGLAMN